MPSLRRLTAILAADVAGYSRLMGADEEGTHEKLKAHLGELVGKRMCDMTPLAEAAQRYRGYKLSRKTIHPCPSTYQR